MIFELVDIAQVIIKVGIAFVGASAFWGWLFAMRARIDIENKKVKEIKA